MPPPPPRCVICHDDLSDTVTPYATTCGHLCCEDCATFHFSFDKETPCPFCRQPIRRDQLFRLYFDFNFVQEESREDERKREKRAGPSMSRSQRELVEKVRSVRDACKQAVDAPETLDAEGIRANVEA